MKALGAAKLMFGLKLRKKGRNLYESKWDFYNSICNLRLLYYSFNLSQLFLGRIRRNCKYLTAIFFSLVLTLLCVSVTACVCACVCVCVFMVS